MLMGISPFRTDRIAFDPVACVVSLPPGKSSSSVELDQVLKDQPTPTVSARLHKQSAFEKAAKIDRRETEIFRKRDNLRPAFSASGLANFKSAHSLQSIGAFRVCQAPDSRLQVWDHALYLEQLSLIHPLMS
jgi:hypothetical protein